MQVLGAGKWLVTLHVDVDLGVDRMSYFVYAVGAAAMLRGRHASVPTVALAQRHDLVGVGSDDNVFQFLGQTFGRARRFVNALDHRFAIDLAQWLAREAG